MGKLSIADIIIRVLAFLLERFERKRNLRGVESLAQIYNAMKNVVSLEDEEDCPVFQFLILKAADSGKAIQPGSQLFLTCMYEDYRYPVASAMRYQKVHVDGSFVDILLQTMRQGSIRFKTDELKQDSLLRMMNEVEDIKYSEMYHLYDRKETVYFCMISTVKDDEGFRDARIRLAIEQALSTIKTRIKRAV